MARQKIKFQGLPARICWVGLGDRHRLGLAFNEMVASGRAARRRSSSAATTSIRARSPRPTAKPKRCKTVPTRSRTGRCLNALLNCASGATWVSLHHGGGVGMGYSQHAGMVIVADGTPEAARSARARAVERSGDRRHAPRRCGIRDRPRLRPRARAGPARHPGLRPAARRRGSRAKPQNLPDRVTPKVRWSPTTPTNGLAAVAEPKPSR